MPDVNGGILTIALVAFTTVNVRRPLPESTWSTVIVFNPLVIANAPKPLGNKLGSSETTMVGLQLIGVGVAVGVSVGVGVAVGVGVGVGVGVAIGVGVVVGVGVGVTEPHCARINKP